MSGRKQKLYSFTREERRAALAEIRQYAPAGDRLDAIRLLPYLGRQGTKKEMLERFARRERLRNRKERDAS